MANTALSDMSTTPASNTSIQGVNIGEGCLPGNLNNAQRSALAQAKGALLAVASSGTNTIAATYAPVPDAYLSGWLYPFKAGGTNTGAATFDASPGGSSSAKDVKIIASGGKQALQGGEIVSGGFYVLQYDGTDMILLNPTPQEGTFTPTFVGASTAGTFTYTNQIGRHIRSGNLVHIEGRITISAAAVSPSGNMSISGLPFTASDIASNSPAIALTFGGITLSSGFSTLTGNVLTSGTSIQLFQSGSALTITGLPGSGIGTSADIIFGGSYRIG